MKFLTRSFRALGLLLLSLLLLIVIAFTWIFVTEVGTRTFMLRILPIVNVHAEGVSGSLLNGLRVNHLSVATSSAQVDIRSIYLDIYWKRLWDKAVAVRKLEIGDVQINLLNVKETPKETQETTFPTLPVDVTVDQFTVGKLLLNKVDGQVSPISIHQIDIQQLQWLTTQAEFSLTNIEINHPLVSSHLKGHIGLNNLSEKNPLLSLDLKAENTSDQLSSPICLSSAMHQALKRDHQDCRVDIALQFKGSLRNLDMVMTGAGNGFSLDSQGKLNVFAPIPVMSLQTKVNVVKGFSANIDAKTKITDNQEQQFTADVTLRDIHLKNISPQSNLGADIHIDALAASLERWKNANIHFKLANNSRWRGIPVSGSGDIGLSIENVVRLSSDLQIRAGNNSFQAQGHWGKPDDILSIQVEAPSLTKLYPNIGQALSLNAQLTGGLQAHQLSLKGYYSKGQTQALGDAPVSIDLVTEGQAKIPSSTFMWGGSFQKLHIKHAGYELISQQPIPIDVQAAEKPQWSIGKTALIFKQPTGKLTELVHQYSSQKDGHVQSNGNIKNLHVQKSMFDVDWQVTNQPTWNVAINMLRTNDTDRVQANPLANVQHLTLTLSPVVGKEKRYSLLAMGGGEKTQIDGKVNLNLNNPLIVDNALLDISLSDGTLLKANATVNNAIETKDTHIQLALLMKNLALDKWSLGVLPAHNLNGEIQANVELSSNIVHNAFIQANFLDNSSWNKQKLSGTMNWLVKYVPTTNHASLLSAYRIEKADTQLFIGRNRIITQGAFGQIGDNLTLDIYLPSLAKLYPSLTGGVSLVGKLTDSISQHKADLSLAYVSKGILQEQNPDVVKAHVVADGGWGYQHSTPPNDVVEKDVPVSIKEGWAGTIHTLTVSYQQYGIQQKQALSVNVVPNGEKGLPEWEIGAAEFDVFIPGKQIVEVHQLGSTGKGGVWTTKGEIHRFVVNKVLLDELRYMMTPEKEETRDIVVRGKETTSPSNLVLDMDWDMSFDGALKGQAHIVRHSGDIVLPLAKPLLIQLKKLSLQLGFTPGQGTHSVLNAQLLLDTVHKGDVKVDMSSDFNGLIPNLKGGTKLAIVGGIKDIAWASAFTNDLLNLGGEIHFNAQLTSTPSGKWNSSGFLDGNNLRIIEVENGVRLLGGTLKATFNNMEAHIEKLHFPSIIRVVPKEWRTRQWIEENPPAQHGSLLITGDWNIETSTGTVKTVLDHYPIVQRADRFAMMSGEVTMKAQLPEINLTGKLVADAGWASIDIKDTVPTVDSDVIILKPGQTTTQSQSSSSEDMYMNLTVDLGPRFYLVGMGLNSGLVGAITLIHEKGRLTAEGQFKTRGGAIEAYGQRLQIAKGEIAFGGNITNPSLNIEAIRRGLEVEAGLRVIGTAKHPKITLVSYPDVSDVEKLSWLIMGRGPDSSSADLALLFSVGSSFIADADSEPFYRKVGIDEVGMKAGSVGESDNILPKRTVADSSAYRGYNEAGQLFYATKKLGNSWKISAEQALSGSGSVVRGGYKLMQYLTVDIKVGTVNGIELLYKRIFKD